MATSPAFRRRFRFSSIVLAGTLAGGCGGESGAQSRASNGSSAADCLPASEVAEAVGFEVRLMTEASFTSGSLTSCGYQATGDQSDTFVSIAVGPDSESAEAMEEVKSGARTMLGTAAQAEPVQLGDGGFAYGSSGKSEGAAVGGGRLYRVDVTSTGLGGPGDKKDAVIAILRKIMP